MLVCERKKRNLEDSMFGIDKKFREKTLSLSQEKEIYRRKNTGHKECDVVAINTGNVEMTYGCH